MKDGPDGGGGSADDGADADAMRDAVDRRSLGPAAWGSLAILAVGLMLYAFA